MPDALNNPKLPHKGLFYLSGGRGPPPSSKEAFGKMCVQRNRQQKLEADFKAAKKEAAKETKQVVQEMKKELREKWGPTGLGWLMAEPKEKRRLMKEFQQRIDEAGVGAGGGGGDHDAAPDSGRGAGAAAGAAAAGAGGGAAEGGDAAPNQCRTCGCRFVSKTAAVGTSGLDSSSWSTRTSVCWRRESEEDERGFVAGLKNIKRRFSTA